MFTPPFFKDRVEAGQKLGKELLSKYDGTDVVVLALLHGGIIIGSEVSKSLKAPLDILLVNSIGGPDSGSSAGFVIDASSSPKLVLNDDIIKLYDLSNEYIEYSKNKESEEIKNLYEFYRFNHPHIELQGKIVILVTDGVDRISVLRAALKGIRLCSPKHLILGTPLITQEGFKKLKDNTDDIFYLKMYQEMQSIGHFYSDFSMPSDEEIIDILDQARVFEKHDKVKKAL